MRKYKNEVLATKSQKQGLWGDVWRRLRKDKLAMVGFVIVCVLVLSAVLADVIAPYDYSAQDLSNALQMPNAQHLLGTDDFGRDMLSRIIYGGRVSLLVAVAGVAISYILGCILGAVAGYFGGAVDNVIMRIMDMIMAIPPMLLAMCVSAILGGGIFQTAVAISVTGIAGACRMMRASCLTVRNQEYIEAAKVCGSTNLRLILSHLVPNCLAPIIVDASLRLGASIMVIASLSFVGLGVQPPTPEWGAILNSGRAYIRDFWPLITFPGIVIMLTMFGFNVLGDGIRDAMDPKLKH